MLNKDNSVLQGWGLEDTGKTGAKEDKLVGYCNVPSGAIRRTGIMRTNSRMQGQGRTYIYGMLRK